AVSRMVVLTLGLAIWEALADAGSVNALFLTSPSRVVVRLVQLFASGAIWPHLTVSGEEALLGFGLAALIGIPIGVIMGRFPLARSTFEPLVMGIYSAPAVAFLPLLILWLGIGIWSKAVLIFLGTVFALIISSEAGVASVDRRLVETARSFNATEWQIITKITLPSAVPFLLAGFRLAVGRVLIMLVVAEMAGATGGIGYLIFQGGAMYDTSLVFAGVTLLVAVGIAANQALRALERRVASWRRPEDLQ
ncbi:MAG TPA: ABC transporter permease, partial [Chloroflexota bacterium]|nr:ABC transporter permease [Chloroflexota bacterium]